jgi:hypothetical protein
MRIAHLQNTNEIEIVICYVRMCAHRRILCFQDEEYTSDSYFTPLWSCQVLVRNMSSPWSTTDMVTVEVTVEYEEEYDTLTYGTVNKTMSPSLQDLTTLLGRPPNSVYHKVLYLYKTPEGLSRLDEKKRSWNGVSNPIHNPVTNPMWNPINNTSRRDRSLTWKMEQTLLQGHNPPTDDEHRDSIHNMMSTPAALVELDTKDCVIHVFVFMFGQDNFENVGWCTTRRLWMTQVRHRYSK